MRNRLLMAALSLSLCALLAACAPATPEQLLSQARDSIAAGDFRTAEIHLKNLLQQQTDNAAARQLLGEVMLEAGDLAGAEQNLRRALELGTDVGAVELTLLRALIGQLKFAEAVELVTARGLPREPADAVEVALLLGTAYRGLGQSDTAVRVYRSALVANPSSADLRTELAATLLSIGQASEARALVAAVLNDEPNFSAALLLRGGLEATGGRREEAEATFQQVLSLEQASSPRSQRYELALAQLVEVELGLGKVDAAVANADALLALGSASPLARYSKALVEVRQGDLDGAEQRLESVVADFPQYWPAHRVLGEIKLRQGQVGQATAYLRSAVNNNPSDNAGRLELAELYVRQGDLDAARNLLLGAGGGGDENLFLAFAARASQAAGLTEQAAQFFEQSEQQAPSTLQQLVGLSNLYMAAGEFDRAVRLLQSSNVGGDQGQQVSDYLLTLIHIRRGDLEAADETVQRLLAAPVRAAWPLNLQGLIALLRNDAAAAGSAFGKALEIEPRNLVATLNMARVANAEKDAAGAERYLRQALQIDPEQPDALLGLAQFATAKGNFAEAESLLAKAPEAPPRMQAEAELAARQGQFDRSAQRFAQVFALEPTEANALRAYTAARRAGRDNPDRELRQWHSDHPDSAAANFALGGYALENGDLASAQRDFEAVVAVSPNHGGSLNNLAWLYGERKDPRALEFGRRALAAEPDNPFIKDTLGWLYVQNGDVAAGLPLLEQAAAALPDERDINFHWGVALGESGETARAVEVLERVTADGKAFGSREEALRRLQTLRSRSR